MPNRDRQTLRRVLERLRQDPSGVNLKKLEPPRADLWRVRSGRWRAVFTFDQAEHLITVEAIDQRKDVYW